MYRAAAQAAFEVATIRPSGGEVKFERNGKTGFAYGTLRMRDVTVSTCIQLAYGTSQGLVSGPASLKDVHYDITAKTEAGTSQQQMRLMLRTLLSERFHLQFHGEKKEMRVYSLVVAPSGIKMRPSAPGGEMTRENNATGMVARSISMHEMAAYLSDPVESPVTDGTMLPGRYDLKIDFTHYVDERDETGVRPDAIAVMRAALKGELGLDLQQRKEAVDVIVVDHVESPSGN